jgi:hypothetical protein
VRIDDIGADIRHARVVTRPPRVSPERLATSPEARSRAMRMVEADGAGRMRPVDRTSRPSLTMRDVERRIRGRSNATRRGGEGSIGARDGAGPSVRREPARSGETPERVTLDRRSTVRTGDRQSTGRSSATDRRSTVKEGNYPSYPRRLGQDRASGNDDTRRDVGRRRPESVRRAEDRSGAGNLAPSAPRVRPRETERAGTDQHVRDLYRKMANPRSTRSPSSDSGRRSQSTTQPRRTPPKPRVTDRKQQDGNRSGDSGSSKTRIATPSRPSTPRSTTRSPAPNRTSTPRSTTRSPAPKQPSNPRSTGSKSGSSKSTSDKKSKRKSDSQSGSRGRKR